MRKGEIWDVVDDDDSHPYRVLIVSADEWNEGVAPQCVEIVRPHGAREIAPYMLLLNPDVDSQGGLLVMDSLSPIDPAAFVEDKGSVGGVTLSKVDSALRKVFAI